MSTHTVIESRDAFYADSIKKNGINSQIDSNSLTSEQSYTSTSAVDIPRGLQDIEDESGNKKSVTIEKLPSSKNPYYNLRLKTTGSENYPLSDFDSAKNMHFYTNLTERQLIESPRGASIYSADDFLYLKHYAELPLNRLITLRRFAYPVFDDIFSKESQSEPDIARMLCYFDNETNKLSDIMSFSFGTAWKQLNSASEAGRMEGGSQSGMGNGLISNAMKFIDPKYGREAARGVTSYDPQHDTNRVYGPVDSIASTMIREVGLKFEQSINLEFAYKMQSINGVNQKAAFIDMLSNIILMGTNDGDFWGGARYWIGVQPSKYMKDMKALRPDNWNDFVSKSTTSMHTLLQSFSTKTNAKETLKNIANNAMNLALGKILNTLGRPGIPVMNSLLTGTPVGPWHLTVGNPYNPIMVAGDLIVDEIKIEFGDELGFDDFPTEFVAKITLKHAKPKDRGGIESMFNAGKGRTYLKPVDISDNSYLHRKIETTLMNPNPRSLTEVMSSDTLATKKFGEYTKDDIMRNKDAVWSFIKKT